MLVCGINPVPVGKIGEDPVPVGDIKLDPVYTGKTLPVGKPIPLIVPLPASDGSGNNPSYTPTARV